MVYTWMTAETLRQHNAYKTTNCIHRDVCRIISLNPGLGGERTPHKQIFYPRTSRTYKLQDNNILYKMECCSKKNTHMDVIPCNENHTNRPPIVLHYYM